MEVKIGPAGLGPVKNALEALDKYHKLGFRACEIAFTYGPYIKNADDALRIGKHARKLGVNLSIHAPYFVNLNSAEPAKREASKSRILECCRIGELLGAKTVVFHPGYYGEDKEESYQTIKSCVIDMIKEIKKNKWEIEIAAETMGKVNVFGSIEEISRLVRESGCGFCIDFAHILARDKRVDYENIAKLFPRKRWHCHFSGIIYGDKGEKSHKPTEKSEWRVLFENLPNDREIIIVNESPTMIEDCIEGLALMEKNA